MQTLAIIYLTLTAANILIPGSPWKKKPRVDWESAHTYLALTAFVCAVILAIVALV